MSNFVPLMYTPILTVALTPLLCHRCQRWLTFALGRILLAEPVSPPMPRTSLRKYDARLNIHDHD